MRSVTLERRGAIGGYRVAGTQIMIRRQSGGWAVSVILRTQDIEWWKRHRGFLEQSFPRLRDAREALEALFSVDPLPTELKDVDQDYPEMKLITPGKYQITRHEDGRTITADLTRHLHRGTGYWWRLTNKDGRTMGHFRTLSEARRGSSGRLAAEAAGMEYYSWLKEREARWVEGPFLSDPKR